MTISISVIIPVYNAEKYLRRAVESAVNLPEVAEIILIEDGSPDNALDVCKTLEKAYTKVKLFRHPIGKNKGAGASRNLGIKNSKYDFIAFLDADDYYLPNRFSEEQKIFATDKTVDGVYGCVKAEFENMVVKEKFLSRYDSEYTTTTDRISPDDLLYKLLFGGSGRFHTNAITIKKSVFRKTGMFDSELKMAQDSELWARLAATCRLVPGEINRPVSIRWVHADNRIHSNDKTIKKYKLLMHTKLFYWGTCHPKLSFIKKNYFFVAFRDYVDKKHPLTILLNLIPVKPQILFTAFFYRKILQLIRQKI